MSDCRTAISKGPVNRGSVRTHCFPGRLLKNNDPFHAEMDCRRTSDVSRVASPSDIAYRSPLQLRSEGCFCTAHRSAISQGSVKRDRTRTYRIKQPYVFVTEVEKVFKQVSVIGQIDKEIINSSPVPVDYGTITQSWAASPCFLLIDRLHLAPKPFYPARWSAEPVRHEICNVESLKSESRKPDEHGFLFRDPLGPAELVTRHARGFGDVSDDGMEV